MKFMIVDDSMIMRRVIEKYCRDFNFDFVGAAPDGMKALELFKAQMPDLVTMDITMPEMDGLTCLEEILKIKPETKVIIVTALKDRETGLTALKLGAKGFLPKPFSEEQIKNEITAVTGGCYD